MVALLVVLLVTNAVTLGAVVVLARDRHSRQPESVQADPQIAEAFAAAAPVATPTSAAKVRRLITVEILNPIELAGGRGRMFGIAGSFVPHLTRRIVYDQTVRQLRDQLAAHNVVADVRVHVLPLRQPDGAMGAEPTRFDRPSEGPDLVGPDPAYKPPE